MAATDIVFACLPGEPPAVPDVVGSPVFSSAFDVDAIAAASVQAAVGAIDELGGPHGVERTASIERRALAATFTTHIEVDGEAPRAWADLSGYYRTSDDRHIQLHCNFPHHAAGVVDLLGCAPDRAAVEEAILGWRGEALEQALIDADMIPAFIRTLDEWAAHPHAAATADLPLLTVEQIGDGDPRPTPRGDRAATGLRVLDCSRVLAGPTAGQLLAAHGADVLRVASPKLPAVEVGVMATGHGKRNTDLDLDDADDRAAFESLLATTDVWVDAYRPLAFADRGLTPEHVAATAPGAVVLQLCAFDWVGPWAGRRGFDSIVQSTTGIVHAGRTAAGADGPTPLPVQALDYATGFLAAAAIAQTVRHQRAVGGTWLVRLSLLRTRNWLVGLGGPHAFAPAKPTVHPEYLFDEDSEFGRLTAATPLSGRWDTPPAPLGTSDPTWLPR